jgi:beta-glucosidase
MMSMMSRRTVLHGAGATALAATTRPAHAAPGAKKLPFLWGAASAGHQVEGGNVNADSWLLEHVQGTLYAQPSGDAMDHYHRFDADIALLASLGLNTFRFSLEWSRIEPEPGEISRAALDHYRRVLDSCHAHGVVPMVTFNHFTNPRWFAARGGWEVAGAADPFLRYCETASRALGDRIGIATTFNEPQLARMINWGRDVGAMEARRAAMQAKAAQAMGAEHFSYYLSTAADTAQQAMIAAHARAYGVIKSGPGSYPVGLSLAMSDDQAVGDPRKRDEKRAWCYDPWLHAAGASDFVGVQAYTRALIGAEGPLPAPAGAERTSIGWEFYPQAIGGAVRYAAQVARVPVIVTENGVSTDDDTRRIAYIDGALAALAAARRDGVDVRGYVHWAFLDTFEWSLGYRPRFSLVEVDRQTFRRSPKPSARHLGRIAAARPAGA